MAVGPFLVIKWKFLLLLVNKSQAKSTVYAYYYRLTILDSSPENLVNSSRSSHTTKTKKKNIHNSVAARRISGTDYFLAMNASYAKGNKRTF